MTTNDPSAASSAAGHLSVAEPSNADAVIQALGNLARAQERDMPEHVLNQLHALVIKAAGVDGDQLAKAA